MREERRHEIRRPADEDCPHDCKICYRYNLQMKWLIGSAVFVLGGLGIIVMGVVSNNQRVSALETKFAVAVRQNEYLVDGVNDIKMALGLKVRLPPKLEALK